MTRQAGVFFTVRSGRKHKTKKKIIFGVVGASEREVVFMAHTRKMPFSDAYKQRRHVMGFYYSL